MQHYHKKSRTDSFKTRRHSSLLYFTLSRFNQKKLFSNMLPNINVTKRHNSVCIQQVRSYVHPIKTENQMHWLKRIRWGRNCQKYFWQMLQNKIKPVYKTNCSRKKNFDRRITTSVPKKVFCIRKKSCFSQKTRTSRFGTKQVEKV